MSRAYYVLYMGSTCLNLHVFVSDQQFLTFSHQKPPFLSTHSIRASSTSRISSIPNQRLIALEQMLNTAANKNITDLNRYFIFILLLPIHRKQFFFFKSNKFSDDAGTFRSSLRFRATSCRKTQQNAVKR